MATSSNIRYAEIRVSDYRDIVKAIKSIEPKIMRNFRKNLKEIAAPAQSAIKQQIPAVAPLSGMVKVHHGQKTWNEKFPARNVVIETPAPKKSKYKYISLGRLRVNSVGTVIADMAGRSGKFIDRYDRTRPYLHRHYVNGRPVDQMRTHAINGQGRRMIEKLNSRAGRTASRYAWAAFERVQPAVQAKALVLLRTTINEINSELKRIK